MGIYLPNMEMPRKGQMLVIFSDGTSYVCFNGMRERLKHTTAFPVPPHGDLIDRAEVVDSFDPSDFWNPDAEDNCFAAIRIVNAAPTIIPAEEGEA